MSASIVWFRQDLRLHDNPALQAALESGSSLLPVYIQETDRQDWAPGAASNWWLHHSLISLQQSLRACGSDLLVYQGSAEKTLNALCEQFDVSQVFWNRCYEPSAIERDTSIKKILRNKDIETKSFNGSLLFEPWENLKKDGTPYRVFTPYWKAMQKNGFPLYSFAAPKTLPSISKNLKNKIHTDIKLLKLLPSIPWDREFYHAWQVGEKHALHHLDDFIDNAVFDYADGRDIPSIHGTSQLSSHLHFGEISPWQIMRSINEWSSLDTKGGSIKAGEVYLRQLGWRDYAHHLLYHFPHTTDKPLDRRFDAFPWNKHGKKSLQRWQQGTTGIPIVDAGMRQLWQTGWMHNRVRMIVASLLTKNLLIPWQLGAMWFWDTLIDANLANNTMGWQWTAGCGADAAPFFRIFNPVRQGERFDPDGDYVRQWVPELKRLPNKWIHQPWEAPPLVLHDADIRLGKNYPEPIVDLAETRRAALSIWNELKNHSRS